MFVQIKRRPQQTTGQQGVPKRNSLLKINKTMLKWEKQRERMKIDAIHLVEKQIRNKIMIEKLIQVKMHPWFISLHENLRPLMITI